MLVFQECKDSNFITHKFLESTIKIEKEGLYIFIEFVIMFVPEFEIATKCQKGRNPSTF